MHGLDMEYLRLSEINLVADKPHVMEELQEMIQMCLGKDATIQAAMTKKKVKYNYKLGGTAAIYKSKKRKN